MPDTYTTTNLDTIDTAWLSAGAAELRAVISYPRGERSRLMVTAHDEDGGVLRLAACPLSADVAPDVNLRGDAQWDAEATAIAWVLSWEPEHEGSSDGSHIIRLW